jgi:hypothetical protein
MWLILFLQGLHFSVAMLHNLKLQPVALNLNIITLATTNESHVSSSLNESVFRILPLQASIINNVSYFSSFTLAKGPMIWTVYGGEVNIVVLRMYSGVEKCCVMCDVLKVLDILLYLSHDVVRGLPSITSRGRLWQMQIPLRSVAAEKSAM